MRRRRRSAGAEEMIDLADAPPPPSAAPADLRARAADEGAVNVERALRLVRVAAAVIAIAAVLAVRTGDASLGRGLLVAAGILGGALLINLFTLAADRKGWVRTAALGGQVLDVAASLALVVLLEGALDDSAWMVLLLPIVMGGVRLGAAGTLLAWTLCGSGYILLAMTGVVALPGDSSDAFTTSLERFAFLLALSVPVAALTQWMQQRWEHQRRLTLAARERASRLELVESVARNLADADEPALMLLLTQGVLDMGAEAVTVTRHEAHRWTTVSFAGGPAELPDDPPPRPGPDETIVTHWREDGERSWTSISVAIDSESTLVLHAWSSAEVEADTALSLGLLGAHARVALKGARLLADLQQQATRDPLTNLLNRRAFDERLDLLAAHRSEVALLVLDLDRFKDINDGHGHPVGDAVLKVIADRLRAATHADLLRGEASVARIGGDEFAVVLAGSQLEEIVQVAERIETSMDAPIAVGAMLIDSSFSIGIADAEGIWTPAQLFEAADGATYQAKTRGRARACWAPGPVGDPTGATPHIEALGADVTLGNTATETSQR